MLSALHRGWRRYRADRAGVSAIEFAFVGPIVLLLLLAGVDTVRYVIATEKLQNVASTIGQMISQNTTGNVNYVDLTFYRDSTMVIFPQVLADANEQGIPWSQDIGITLSMISFSLQVPGCTGTCVYVPKVLWTGGRAPRSCIVPLLPASNSAIPTPATLPTDLFGPNAVIAIDVSYRFRPTLASAILPALTVTRSYYVSPRFVSLVQYQTIQGDNGIVANCP